MISQYYNASFSGVSFFEQSNGLFHPGKGITTEGKVNHQPGSNVNTYKALGSGKEPFTLTIAVDAPEYLSLWSKRGNVGTLSYSHGSVSNIYLKDIIDSPGKIGNYDTYIVQIVCQPVTYVKRPTIVVQVDSAVFPSHSITDISNYVDGDSGIDIDLNTDNDCGSAQIKLTSLPGSVSETYRIYVYANGTLVFNGFLPPGGISYNEDTTVTLHCVDALYKLRNSWGGDDREYWAANGDTMRSVVTNIVEAASVDASLHHIEGDDRAIGNFNSFFVYGGNIDPLTGDPTEKTVMIDAIRTIDKGAVPRAVTFTRGNGAVYRVDRAIGSSVASFDTDNAWGWQRQGVPNSIINKWLVKGQTLVDIPTEAESQAANSLLVTPFDVISDEWNAPIVDDDVWCQDLADSLVTETNGILYEVSWTTYINNQTNVLGSTVTTTCSWCDLSSTDVFVKAIKHHIDKQTATTSYVAEFRVY